MGNFRSNDRGGRRDSFRGSSGGFNRGRGGFGGDRGGFGRDRGPRRPVEMHDAVCDKCKQECQVPFRPTPGKPVLCSDCFKSGGSSRPERSSPSQSGISSDQFKQINNKLDKILEILESLEIVEEDGEGEVAEEEGEDSEDDEESIVEDNEGEEDESEDESEEDESEGEVEEEPAEKF